MRQDLVIFVAHDVGGSGGMERHNEELIEHLLDCGRAVTVVARTCLVEPREGLRFVRIPTPRRPFVLAYPAFFALASLRVTRRGDALLHTCGAIVANRADVSTVHYCHRAAAVYVREPRASRPGTLFRLNSAISAVLSHAAEFWCYRPARTKLLCAVSTGVAKELCDGFPQMRDAVRSIPNGVDSAVFRPDPEQRRAGRVALGLDENARLALFVGGDWGRKGLAFAVGALAGAPMWHLAVAGRGDREPLLAQARADGTDSRLHFLGSVRDMPRMYAAADAFVLPTTYEAFPLVALEAAASGLPLLVTRVNGVEDLLEDGRNGWFVARDAGDIARRLEELGADLARARAMAAAARASVAPYSWQAMAEGYVALYTEIERKRSVN